MLALTRERIRTEGGALLVARRRRGEPPGVRRDRPVLVARLFGTDPQRELEEDLERFKDFAERELTPEQKQHAENLAAQCLATHYRTCGPSD